MNAQTAAGPGPHVGDRAPDFTVRTTEGPPFTLSEAVRTEAVVLVFFPAAFTSVCTKEMCTFTERMPDFHDLGARVLGISGDAHYAQKAWADKHGIKALMGSDYNHEVTPAYGVAYPLWRDFYRGVPKRSVFVIDRKGIVRYRWVSEDATVEPDYDEVRRAVAALA